MSTITCLKELEERGILEYDDIVEFTVNNKEILKYEVKDNYLHNKKKTYDNDRIFEILNIHKNKIAEKEYKYKPLDGAWPISKDNDFLALTRLVKELYLIIEKQKPVYTKFTRFEIMEI